ncbi:HXXXD-type acyl-transferase family protein [Euphorbia peplus]|nr:HXXXD-type acyl-transferase family protein [Euphorbia peplus]
MSMILQDPEVAQLEKLVPFNSQEMSSDEEILRVQVNHFDCGGMTISICIWHQIGDASAVASFATTWARIASDKATTNFEGIIYDCTSIFPPQNIEAILWNTITEKNLLGNIMMKRFVFDHSKLAALRVKVGNKSSVDHLGNLSRVETVAAVIWGVVLDLVRVKEETTNVNAGILVGLRKRMVPPLPELSPGNINLGSISITNCFKNESLIDYNNLARKIHQSIEIVKDDYVRKIYEGGQYFESMRILCQTLTG